ncbi:MAG: hypothetical protein WCF36_21055 [Candidatus Nanopelagicales bacterium]
MFGISMGAAALLLTISGCGSESDVIPPPTLQPGNEPALGACDLVLDVTGRPGVEWVRSTLDQGFDRLATTLCQDRTVTANLITDYSKASTCPEPTVNTNFSKENNSTRRDRLRKEAWFGIEQGEAVVAKGVRQKVDDLINCGLYGPGADPATAEKIKLEGTDVLSAIQTSSESMDGLPSPRTLVLFSDMRNTMPPLKMPFKGDVPEVVASLESDGVIPDLDGAEVVVVGPGTNNDLSPAQQAKLVRFWDAYFEAANAGSVDFRQTLG